jgi:hypothetical protein
MKKIVLSVVAMSSLMFAGGDIVPVPVPVSSDIEENGFYLGASIVALSARDSRASLSFIDENDMQDRLGNVSLHAGYWVTEYLAIEGRYSSGFQDEDVIKMDDGWSLFLKPTYKFDDDDNRANGENYFAVYGLLGYGNVSFKGVNQLVGDVDESDFQWGLGASYTFRADSSDANYTYRDNWTVFADYTSLGRDMEGIILNYPRKADADAFSLGIVYHF